MLVPLTGERAALGLSMQRAAMLAQKGENRLVVLDTHGTAAGAAEAARKALDEEVAMILGPLTHDAAGAVANAAAGRVPVIAFTNDPAVRATGVFVFGITAGQLTSAVLRYARSRGVRDVAVISDGGPWAAASASAAMGLQGALGMDVRTIEVRAGAPLPAVGEAPHAVLIPGGGETIMAAARNLKGTGIQLLGTMQALDHRPSALEVLDGAWLASPDPESFATFARAFEARNGGDPGAITALAYDASLVASTLREKDALSREGLLNERSFPCVTGPLRFRADGSVARDLAILVASPSGYEKVAVSQGA